MLRQLINYVNSLRKIKVTCMTNEFRHSTIWEYSPHDCTLWPHVKLLCLISIHFKIVCLIIHPDVVHSLTLLWFLFTRKLAIQFVLSIVQRQRTHRKLYIYMSVYSCWKVSWNACDISGPISVHKALHVVVYTNMMLYIEHHEASLCSHVVI